tara:strand:- start:132 stop:548 length:417 start_codon:yes stop_codon:yes gene_type:complete
MNIYYNQLDIKTRIEPYKGTMPEMDLHVNDKVLYSGTLKSSMILNDSIGLLEKFNIRVALKNKDYNNTPETAIIVQSLCIDDFEIIPEWTHLVNYSNDHDYGDPTNHLGFNGEWVLEIPEPFYRWKHKVLNRGWLLEP